MKEYVARGRVIVILARSNHPKAWGVRDYAHGYVVLAVACTSLSQAKAVAQAVERKGIPEPHGHSRHWFGGGPGDFDHLFTILDWTWGLGDIAPRLLNTLPVVINWSAVMTGSLGDYRQALIYDAGPLLREIGRLS